MSRKTVISFAFFAISFAFVTVSSSEEVHFESCLQSDSISCVQMYVYQKLRSLFSKDKIYLPAGFLMVKDGQRSLGTEEDATDKEMLGTSDITERELVLENYVYDKFTNFFKERSFEWNLNSALEQIGALMTTDNASQDTNDNVISSTFEGRGRKKLLKSLIPVLIAAKLKIISFLKISYIVIALLAKKALVISAVSLAITLFIAIKKLLSKHHHPHHYEVHGEAYHGSIHHPVVSSGWPSGGWSGYDSYDLHGAHSQQSHNLVYSAQKPSP